MRDGDLVVILELATLEGLEDLTHALHPKRAQFGGANGAHARRAEHAHPLGQRVQDLLVPHAGLLIEQAVDDGNGFGLVLLDDRKHVSERDGREVDRVQHLPCLGDGKRGSQKDIDAHRVAPFSFARARCPGS